MLSITKTSHRLAIVLAVVFIAILIGVVQAQYEPAVAGDTNQVTAIIAGNPESLDPATTFDGIALQITSHIYEPLVVADESNEYRPGPGLAESWTVSPDGLTWTFNIRPGAKFHDGTEANAGAVVYNINRWWDPDHPYYAGDSTYFSFLFGGPKGEADSSFLDVTAVEPLQVTIQLKEPDSNVPAKLSYPTFGIASPKAIQAGMLAGSPVGSGPYKFVAWQVDQYVELAANDQWAAMPEMEKLRFQIISDPEDRLTALKSGQAQTSTGLENLLDEIQMAGNLRVEWHPSNDVGYLGINRAHTPLDNLLVRQAIAHAVNRKALVANFFTPGDLVAKDLMPPQLWGADPNIEDYAYDPQMALNLLNQAGYPNGFAITLSFRDLFRNYLPDPAVTAAAIANDLEAVGIKVTVEQLESGEFINQLYAGQLELYLLGWTADYPHPLNIYVLYCVEWIGPRDDELCDTLDESSQATSQAEVEALMHKVSRRAHETVPMLPVVHSRQALVIYRDLFHVSYFWGFGANYSTAVYADSHSYLPVTTWGK